MFCISRRNFARTRRLGRDRLERLVRAEVTRAGAKRPCFRITSKLFAALDDPAGVLAHRRGALERVHLLLEDYKRTYADSRAFVDGGLGELLRVRFDDWARRRQNDFGAFAGLVLAYQPCRIRAGALDISTAARAVVLGPRSCHYYLWLKKQRSV
jgi:hypothetical protein